MDADAVAALRANMDLYTKVLHQMVSDSFKPSPEKYKDLSFHMRYVKEYDLSHYMVTSLTATAHGIIDAAKEALALNIEEKESQLQQMNEKLAALQKKYDTMLTMKQSLKERSLARKNGDKLPPFKNRWGKFIKSKKQKDGQLAITVDTSSGKVSKKKKPKDPLVFENEYLFEHNFVDPYLKRYKRIMGQIRGRIHNMETKIAALKRQQDAGHPSICFGGKKLARQRHDLWDMVMPKPFAKDRRKKPADEAGIKDRAKSTKRSLNRRNEIKGFRSQKKDPTPGMIAEWRRRHEQSLNREMVLVGRKDLSNGNAMVKYDSNTKALTYKISKDTVVVFPNVVFPYGQDSVNKAVAAHDLYILNNKKPRKKRADSEKEPQNEQGPESKETSGWDPIPVTWSIKDCGSAFLIKCMIEVPTDPHINTDHSTGYIGFDMNYDHLAVSEVDGKGGKVAFKNIPFKMTTHSGGQNKNEISNAIEQVFKMAKEANKPIVMEDIKKIKQKPMYGNKKKNRKVSQFAYAEMKALAMSKSQKHKIGVKEVNPAFTSQIGKLKYMKQLGVSIHDSAAFVIARRGLDLEESIPDNMKHLIPEEKQDASNWSKWGYIANALKEIPTHRFYGNIDYEKYANLKELKKALT